MTGWRGHVVWLVIDMVEQLYGGVDGTLAGGARKSARRTPGDAADPLAYAYCSGVLSTRAIEDRCRVDATFRLACAGLVPDHSTISRFRQRACGGGGLMEDVFYAVLRVCAAAGLGGRWWWRWTGSRSARMRRRRRTGPRLGCGSWPRRSWPGPRRPRSRARPGPRRTCWAGRRCRRGGPIRGRGWPGCRRAWRTSPRSGRLLMRPGGRRGRPGWMRRRPASR